MYPLYYQTHPSRSDFYPCFKKKLLHCKLNARVLSMNKYLFWCWHLILICALRCTQTNHLYGHVLLYSILTHGAISLPPWKGTWQDLDIWGTHREILGLTLKIFGGTHMELRKRLKKSVKIHKICGEPWPKCPLPYRSYGLVLSTKHLRRIAKNGEKISEMHYTLQ